MLASCRLAQDRIVILAGDVFGPLKYSPGAGHCFQIPTITIPGLFDIVGYGGVANVSGSKNCHRNTAVHSARYQLQYHAPPRLPLRFSMWIPA
jgi:hypothetical protein